MLFHACRRFVFIALFAMPYPVSAAPADDEFFEKEVRPLLVERCLECHGEKKPRGGLRLISRAHLLKGGDTGPAIVAGKPKESLLIHAIEYVDKPRMPPKGKLSDREIKVLTKWVQAGAPWPGDSKTIVDSGKFTITDEQRRLWSFQPVKAVKAPEVKDAKWPRSDLDRFILAPLEAKGLAPAKPADKRTLLRRATYDLTGLPPTPDEIHSFLKDESPDALAKVVDRLLASPAYGERWGRDWLDLVRYTDSFDARGVGGPEDVPAAWRYRDWVVNAFNRDLPYDQFLIDQIAGDVVHAKKPSYKEGIIATGIPAIGNWGDASFS
jgi:mono/diheme cytochrome c family protein